MYSGKKYINKYYIDLPFTSMQSTYCNLKFTELKIFDQLNSAHLITFANDVLNIVNIPRF